MFKRIRKIQTKITAAIISLVLVVALFLGVFSALLTNASTLNAMEHTMAEAASLAASTVSHSILSSEQLLVEIAAHEIVTSPETTVYEKARYMDERAKANGFHGVSLADRTGYDAVNRVSHSGEKYFTEALKGYPYFSEPILDEGGQSVHLMMAVPVYIDGSIEYVACFECDQSFLQDIIAEIRVGTSENADTYIIGGSGVTVASAEFELVLTQENLYKQAQSGTLDKEYEALAAIETAMVNGESGVGEWTEDGVEYIQSYAPIDNTDGWSIGVSADLHEFTRTADIGQMVMAAFVVIIALICILIARLIGKSIATPIVACSGRLELLSKGDLHTKVPAVHTQDEVRVLSDSMSELVKRFNDIISEVGDSLSSIAKGDLTHESNKEKYPGDFVPLQESLCLINNKLNETMLNIESTSQQVAAGAEQVSTGAQALAQGATEQASAVQELAATIGDISAHTRETAENADSAKRQAEASEKDLTKCNDQMQEMLGVMREISDNSSEIQKIIKVIEDITFQTNILALNAAVEAARAGAAGKGFAVVADEVRSLASKTAESSGNIAPLIEKSVRAAQRGMTLANETAKSLNGAVHMSKETAETLVRIAEAAGMQAASVEQVTEGVDQISSVVQTNSATSEESAAASQELSTQARVMKELVDTFELKKDVFKKQRFFGN